MYILLKDGRYTHDPKCAPRRRHHTARARQPCTHCTAGGRGIRPESQLATVGFKLRDATQAFAAIFVEQYKPAREEPDPTRVKNRLKSLVETYKSQLGDRRAVVLDAMVDLWDADVNLIQRQTHADEKARKPLTVNDGRRIVFLTMFLMIEFASLLDEIQPPPPATLEPAGQTARQRSSILWIRPSS